MTRLEQLIADAKDQDMITVFKNLLKLCEELEVKVDLLTELLELKEEKEQIESGNEKLRKILADLKKGE